MKNLTIDKSENNAPKVEMCKVTVTPLTNNVQGLQSLASSLASSSSKNRQLATNDFKNQEKQIVQELVTNCEWMDTLANSLYSSIHGILSK